MKLRAAIASPFGPKINSYRFNTTFVSSVFLHKNVYYYT
ncbi:hypothetical protein KSF78_0000995 [Schistosoma japonicum]|nr:hypothetical protein KSF78_0000995 [Schistosoma japonicum]